MKRSVALCTYNGEKYIEKQLKSILDQSVPVDEIIICDDGSKDQTLALAKKILSASHISWKIEKNPTSLGVANNFLKALKMTSGDFVFTCDQDDMWHPDKVKIFSEAAEQSEKELYFSDGVLIDSEDASLGNSLWEAYDICYDTMCKTELMHILIKKSLVTGAAMMVTRSLIDRVDEIPEGWLHDEWFSIVAALKDSALPIPKKTFYYRQHGKNVVGAEKLRFADKLKIWLSNYKKIDEIHQIYYRRSRDIFSLAKNTKYTDVAKQSFLFWKKIESLSSKNRLQKIFTLSKLFLSGRYGKFYTGARGFLRDLLSFLLF